jgi:hypothetical protein
MRVYENRAKSAIVTMAFGAALCLTGSAGRCDVKIVMEVETSGKPAQPTLPERRNGGQQQTALGGPQDAQGDNSASTRHTLTIVYKDHMARTETDDGEVALYDGAAKKLYRFNPEQKTYCMLSLDAAVKQENSLPGPMPSGMRLDSEANVDATGLTKVVAGQATRKYTLDGYFRIIRDSNGMGGGGLGRGGGRRGGRGGGGFPGGGGGGFPGGNGGGGGGDGSSGPPPGGMGGGRMPTTQVDGEYWLADVTLLPAGGRTLLLPLLEPTAPAGPMLKPLYDRFSKLKMIPLASRITLRTPAPNSSDEPFVINTEIKSITEFTAEDALFKVPDGYQKIDAAAFARQAKHKDQSQSATTQ